MAVSYLSKPLQSSPYVLPVDLNLFQNVMAIKQKQFEVGHDKIQQEVDQMGMLDVVRPEDKDYLNSKINNLVSSINGYGGVDFSDPATTHQIEGLGSDIYGDDKVINAISSTRSVRNLVKSYNDYKTNPKLNKLYSPVNEAYDMRRVNDYMSQKGVGVSYQGPAQATPYTPYRENMMKALEKLKADQVVTIDQNGLYIIKKTGEAVTPDRVMGMASDLLLPEEQAQMKRDSWYVYNVQSPTAPETMIKKGMEQYYQSVADTEKTAKYYQEMADASVSDPTTRQKYIALATETNKTLADLKSKETSLAQSTAKAYQADPEEFGYQVYRGDFLRGMANRFSYKKEDVSIQFDQAKMFNARMEQAQVFHNDAMAIKREELNLQKEKNAIDLYGKVYKKINPDGSVDYLPADGGEGLNSINSNTQDPSTLVVTPAKVIEMNTKLEMEKDQKDLQFLDELTALYPNLSKTVTSKSGTGSQRIIGNEQAQLILEGANGRPGFQIDDLKGAQNKDISAKLIKSGLTEENVKFLGRIADNYQAILDGRGGDVPDLPKGFTDLVESKRMLDVRIKANKTKMDQISTQVLSKANLNNDEIQLWNDYKQNPAKYVVKNPVNSAEGMGGIVGKLLQMLPFGEAYADGVDPRIAKISKKIQDAGIDYDKEIKDLYAPIQTRDVFRTHTFSKQETATNGMQITNWVKQEHSLKHGEPINGSSKVSQDEVTGVNPIATGMDADGTFYLQAELETGTGADKGSSMYKFKLDDKQAKSLNLNRSPYESLDYAVNLMGRAEDLPVYSTKDLAVSVDVVRSHPRDANDPSSFTQMRIYHLDELGKRTGDYELVELPGTQGRNASEAYALAKELIQSAGRNPQHPMTLEEFRDAVLKANKKQTY